MSILYCPHVNVSATGLVLFWPCGKQPAILGVVKESMMMITAIKVINGY